MSTNLSRHALNGDTMGTRWSALFHMPAKFDVSPVRAAMAAVVAQVDAQMSTWKLDSDLMRLNTAPIGDWVSLPDQLMAVLSAALDIGRASDGTFDIGVGDAVTAWGFGREEANADHICVAFSTDRKPVYEVLELDPSRNRARKHAGISLDLSGIAKGYGVDCLTDTARTFGLDAALLSIDGELRGFGLQPSGEPWTIAIEQPDVAIRKPMAILSLQDAAVATSGDYRHRVHVGDRFLSHTMDPRRGGPLPASPASVTVVAETCMLADGWATALMVKGRVEGSELARKMGLNALFVERDGEDLIQTPVGTLFDQHVKRTIS